MSFRSNPKEWDEIQRRGVTRPLTTGTEAQAEKNKTSWTRGHARDVFEALRGRGRKEPSLRLFPRTLYPECWGSEPQRNQPHRLDLVHLTEDAVRLRGDSLNQRQQTEKLQPLAEYPSDLRFCLLASAKTSTETQSRFVIFAVWDAFT